MVHSSALHAGGLRVADPAADDTKDTRSVEEMPMKVTLSSVVVAGVAAVLAVQPAAAAPPLPDSTTVHGVPVTVIQKNLNAAGKTVATTGVWDTATRKAWMWFAEKYTVFPSDNVTPAKLTRLQNIADRADIPRACTAKGTVICADRRMQVIRLMRNGAQIDSADAVFGIGKYATRTGAHRVHTKTRFLISDLSGTPMPYSLFFSRGQAIHYSKAFNRRGYEIGTLGCVAIGDKRFAKRLYYTSSVGQKVVVH
jgi:hypothetical protein